MTEITKTPRKELGSPAGVELYYVSSIANGYTFSTPFSNINAAFFQPTTYGYKDPGEVAAAVGISHSAGKITFAVSGTIAAGYLQVWGE